jgi:DNA-binding MarR family transcriptional regulator
MAKKGPIHPDLLNFQQRNPETQIFTEQQLQAINETIRENGLIEIAQLDFLVIPAQYLRAEDLNWTEKALMSFIRLADQEHHCWARNSTLAKWTGVKAQTIKNMIGILKVKGYIEQISYDPATGRRVIRCLK